VKKLFFALGSLAVAVSTAWTQNDPGFYYFGTPDAAAQPESPANYGFDPTAHYWDYYRFEPGHGIDVDRTTPP
jgi:hypothetical protein